MSEKRKKYRYRVEFRESGRGTDYYPYIYRFTKLDDAQNYVSYNFPSALPIEKWLVATDKSHVYTSGPTFELKLYREEYQ